MAENGGGPSIEMLRTVMNEAAKERTKLARAIKAIECQGHACGEHTVLIRCENPAVFGGIYDGSQGYTYQIPTNEPAYFCEKHMGMIVREAFEMTGRKDVKK